MTLRPFIKLTQQINKIDNYLENKIIMGMFPSLSLMNTIQKVMKHYLIPRYIV